MKQKITLTILSVTIAFAMLAASAHSQNNFTGARNMGAINSTGNEAAAVISPNGLSLYFTSNRTGGQGQSDIWVSHRTSLSSAWGAPQNLGATVNTNATESIGSFSIDGKTMFLQSDRTGGFGLRDGYLSMRTDPNNDFAWTTPVNLGPVINSTSDDLAATYFEDQNTGVNSIFFGSDRDGTPGFGYHIYQAVRNPNGTFNAPVPVNELNAEVETRVAIRRDGLEIFIASGRAGGMAPGQFDIWRATRTSTSAPWNVPTLSPGINTVVDEQAPTLSPDGSLLYFASARGGGSGGNDLYSVTRCSMYSASPCAVNRTVSDFNGDGISDLSVFRPSEGNWYIMESGTNTFRAEHFGANGDKVVPGDYDGDGMIDLAVFRPSTGIWWIQKSSNPTKIVATHWGVATDKPVPGDYDGDGITDIAIFRDGTWYIVYSSTGEFVYQFGLPGDVPIAAPNTQ